MHLHGVRRHIIIVVKGRRYPRRVVRLLGMRQYRQIDETALFGSLLLGHRAGGGDRDGIHRRSAGRCR
jgi:hypothetical protein